MSKIAADNNKAAIGVNVAPILLTPSRCGFVVDDLVQQFEEADITRMGRIAAGEAHRRVLGVGARARRQGIDLEAFPVIVECLLGRGVDALGVVGQADGPGLAGAGFDVDLDVARRLPAIIADNRVRSMCIVPFCANLVRGRSISASLNLIIRRFNCDWNCQN